MNTVDTKPITPVVEMAESRPANLVAITGGREVSVFERGIDFLMRKGGDIDLEKLQQMMQMHERWEENQARKAFVRSMAQFKKNPPDIVKDKKVGYEDSKGNWVGYSHATLGAVCDAVIAGLAEVGISHDWKPRQPDGKVGVACYLTHMDGHKDDGTYIEAPADTSGKKNAIQSIGSTITFLERYTLLAAVGLAPKDLPDDDGDGHADPIPDWVDVYMDTVKFSDDLATLMAAWKTAAGGCRRRGGREEYALIQQAVKVRCGELGITTEQWAAAAGEKKA